MFEIRDDDRYGRFKANSDEGEIEVAVSIYGFGDEIEVYKNGKCIISANNYDDEDAFYEDDDELIIYGDRNVTIYKPFIENILVEDI